MLVFLHIYTAAASCSIAVNRMPHNSDSHQTNYTLVLINIKPSRTFLVESLATFVKGANCYTVTEVLENRSYTSLEHSPS